MNLNQFKIVFVDNSVQQVFKTIETLRKSFKDVFVFNQETEFMEFIDKSLPDAILINLDFKPNDALILLREIRNKYKGSLPFVIIYSEKGEDFVQEMSYHLGADSFINFHNKGYILELFLKNLLRRITHKTDVKNKPIIIDAESFQIYKFGKAIQLPRKEFKLFEFLYSHPGRFLTKEEIALHIWNNTFVAGKRTIDVHIHNIRQLLGNDIIQTKKGKGYRVNYKMTT